MENVPVISRKKLIEVALPLQAINLACEQDKERKTGHIRNLHKWFAPMPLPAWRAALFASLIDDPSCCLAETEAEKERERLFELIRRMLPLNADQGAFEEAQKELHRHLGDDFPTIVDPFCGGGSTVLEAQRLGFPTFASDLNPVPALITTMLTGIPPFVANRRPVNRRDASNEMESWNGLRGFVADVKFYAEVVRERAWNRLSHLYPNGPDGNPIIAWRWARTVASPDPRMQGSHTPLVTDWWLAKRVGRPAWIDFTVTANNDIEFSIAERGTPPKGNTSRSGGKCLLTGEPIPSKYIREQGKGGKLGLRMLAFVTAGQNGHNYFPGNRDQEKLAESAHPDWAPDADMPPKALGFRVQEYGITKYSQLFTARQSTALNVFAVRALSDSDRRVGCVCAAASRQ
jgi:putative DNA methylase